MIDWTKIRGTIAKSVISAGLTGTLTVSRREGSEYDPVTDREVEGGWKPYDLQGTISKRGPQEVANDNDDLTEFRKIKVTIFAEGAQIDPRPGDRMRVPKDSRVYTITDVSPSRPDGTILSWSVQGQTK